MNKSREYNRIFNHLDEDRDGKISPLDLQRGVCSMKMEMEIRLIDVETVVGSMEPGAGAGNGLLGLDGFVSLMESSDQEERMEDLRKAFGMYEMSGSECITPKSLNRMLSRLGESRTVDECVVMINQFDLNGDGVLSFDEFQVMML